MCTPVTQQSSESEDSGAEVGTRLELKPALGQFWSRFADHKVLIDFVDSPHQFNLEIEGAERLISLLASKSSLAPTKAKCIQIFQHGIA